MSTSYELPTPGRSVHVNIAGALCVAIVHAVQAGTEANDEQGTTATEPTISAHVFLPDPARPVAFMEGFPYHAEAAVDCSWRWPARSGSRPAAEAAAVAEAEAEAGAGEAE